MTSTSTPRLLREAGVPATVCEGGDVDGALAAVVLGLGRIVALYGRSSTLFQIHEHIDSVLLCLRKI